jgi:glycosyltransferase 2 family protein
VTKRSLSSYLQACLGIALSGGIIIWLWRSLDWSEVGRHLGQLNYLMFVPCIAAFLLQMWVRAVRWRYLLPEGDRLPVLPLFDALMVGNLATYILPLRAGEFVRPYMYTLRSSYSFSTAFVSVVIERFFDLSFVLLSFAVLAANVSGLANWVYTGAAVLSIVALGIFIFILTGIFAGPTVLALAQGVLRPLPVRVTRPLLKFLEDFLSGARVLHNPVNLLVVSGLTLAVWLLTYLLFYLFLFLFSGFEPSVWLSVTLGVIVALAVAAPSAPGFIGVFQVACVVSFGLFGISEEAATAYALVTHAFHYVAIGAFGVLGLLRNNLNLRELAKRSDAVTPGVMPVL